MVNEKSGIIKGAASRGMQAVCVCVLGGGGVTEHTIIIIGLISETMSRGLS